MSLNSLLRREDAPLMTAADWNELVEQYLRTRPNMGPLRNRGGYFPHPWRVTVSKIAAAADGLTWSVSILPGTVNDEMATIPYLRTGDPREWVMPEDYPSPAPGQSGYHPRLVERPLHDRTPPAPELRIHAPAVGTVAVEFTLVVDSARPPFFRTEAEWENDLWRASVYLSADPGRIVLPYDAREPYRLRRYRVFAGKLPAAEAAQTGGHRELARLWLTRPHDATGPESDTITVQQREFWNLHARLVQPGSNLAELVNVMMGDDPLSGVLGAGVLNIIDSSAYVAWWSG